MKFHLHACLLAGLVASIAIGCEPRPVVVEPGDGGTTIIEEDETEIDAVPNGTTTQPETGVDVNVGGERGVDVNVNPAAPDANAPGSSTNSGQNANPNATQ